MDYEDEYPTLAVRAIDRYIEECTALSGRSCGIKERLAIMFALAYKLSEGVRADASNAGVQQVKNLVEKAFHAGWKAGAERRPF